MTKGEWGDIHWWVAVAVAVAVVLITLLHLVIDYKALKGAARYLVNYQKGSGSHTTAGGRMSAP